MTGGGEPILCYRTPDLDRRAFARMSIATDDANTVHIDEPAATALGLPSAIGSGGFVLGLMDLAVRRQFGVGALQQFDLKMQAPILPGRWLEVRLLTAGADQSGAAGGSPGLHEYEFVIVDSADATVAKGTVALHTGSIS